MAGRTQELLQSRTRLRALVSDLTLTEQRERQRLATELHDYLAQLLVFGRMKLSQAKRGFTCQIPRYKVFNYILYWLHTGCQWEEIPIASVPGSEKKKSATVPSTCTFLTGATMAA